MNVAQALRSSGSSAFFSFFIGIGFAIMLFHRPVEEQKSLALAPSQFEGKTVKVDGSCYLYRVEDASCDFVGT